ncbi:MAG: DUF1127 domain-containing protein [Tabrizicola sp.]
MSSRRLALPVLSHLHLAVAALARIPYRIAHRTAVARSRRSLSRLDDHLLRDIGLSRSQALAEAERRGWDAPSHWKS